MRSVRRERPGWFYLLLGHAVLIQVVTFLLRPAISYRALELGVPASWLGIISGSFAVAPLVLAIPSGRLTDRRGERPLMVLGSGLVLGAALVLLFRGGTLTVLMVSSAVLGSGHLLSVVGEQSLVANRTAVGRHDTAFGRYTFAAAAGQAIGPGLIAIFGGSGTFPDARSVFRAAVVAAALFVVITMFIPGSPRQSAAGTAPTRLGTVLRLPGLLQALFTSSIVLAAVDITLVYLPAVGADRGLSSGVVGLLLLLRAASSMVSRLGLGQLATWLGRRRLMVGSVGLAAASMALMALPVPVWALGALLAVAGFTLGIGQPLTMSWLAEVSPLGLRGTAMSLRLTGNRLGQVLIPSLVGLVATGVGAAGVLGVSAVGLAAAGASSRRFATPTEGDP